MLPSVLPGARHELLPALLLPHSACHNVRRPLALLSLACVHLRAGAASLLADEHGGHYAEQAHGPRQREPHAQPDE